MSKKLLWAVFLAFWGWQISVAQAKINIFEKPRYIPALSFYGGDGKAYGLKDFKDDLLMAVIWSKTCGPCLDDMKYLNKFVQKTSDKGIRVILISPEKEFRTFDERRNFLKKIGAPDLISYSDRNANFQNGMGIFITPTVVLVNNKGEEVGQITGGVKWDDEKVIDYMVKLKDDSLKELDERESANKQK